MKARLILKVIGAILLLLCLLATASWIGYLKGYNTHIIYRTEYIDRIVHEPIIVEKKSIIEIIVEKPIELREFVSLQELEDWLEQDKTDATLYFTGEMDLSNPHSKYGYDCDDFAYRLQKSALARGYLMSTEIIVENGEQHMINSAIIGNNIYFIEPRTGEIWLGAYRD